MHNVLVQTLTDKILSNCHEVKYVIKYNNFQKGLKVGNEK